MVIDTGNDTDSNDNKKSDNVDIDTNTVGNFLNDLKTHITNFKKITVILAVKSNYNQSEMENSWEYPKILRAYRVLFPEKPKVKIPKKYDTWK